MPIVRRVKVTIKLEIHADIADIEALEKQALHKVINEVLWDDHEDRAVAIAEVYEDLRYAVDEVLDVDAVLEKVDSMSVIGYHSQVILGEWTGDSFCSPVHGS